MMVSLYGFCSRCLIQHDSEKTRWFHKCDSADLVRIAEENRRYEEAMREYEKQRAAIEDEP